MNRIYRVIFNRSRGLYQVVSEIAKRGGKEKSSRTSGSSLRRGAGIALCIAGIMGRTLSVQAADEYVLKTNFDQEVQNLNTRIDMQSMSFMGYKSMIDQQVNGIGTKVDGIDAKAIANEEAISALTKANGTIDMIQKGLQDNKEAINEITKDGGKLDKTIDQVNTMLDATGQGMQRLQDKQIANSGAIAQLKTAVADITKDGGVVDTNKKAIATNAGNIQANKDQIGKNTNAIATNTQALATLNGPDGTIAKIKNDIQDNKDQIGKNKEEIGKNTTAISKNAQALDALNGPNGTIATIQKDIQTNKDQIGKANEAIEKAKTDLAEQISKAKNEIGQTNQALDGRVSQNTTDIQSNKDQIGKNTQALDALNGPDGTIAGIKKDIQTNKDDIKKNHDDLANAKTELGDKINTTKSDLESKITTDIGTAKTDLEDKIKKAQEEIGKTNEALEGRVSQNEKDIKQNKEDIKQNKEDIKNLRQTVSDNKEAADNALTTAKKELNKTIGDNKTAAENALKAAKTDLNKTISDTKNELSTKIDTTKSDLEKKISDNKEAADNALTTVKNDLQNKIDTTNETLTTTKTELSNKIDTTKSDLEKVIGDNKKDADTALTKAKEELNKTIGDNKTAAENALKQAKTDLNKTISDNKEAANNALTTVKNDLQGKIDTTNQNLNQAKTDLTNKINKDVGDAKTALAGQISSVNQNLQGQINVTNQTVATNQQKTDDNFKKIEEYLKKRADGQAAGQENLGLKFGKDAPLGFRYFRTNMDNKHDADPKGANSMAIGISTTSGDGSIGIAAGGPAGALTAGGENSIGIGNGVEIGDKDNANTIAIGTEAKILKQSEGAIAIGNAANIVATNKYAIAIGAATQTFAEESMALGHSAKTYMKGGVAIGQDAQVGEYIEPPVLDGDVKQDGLGTGIDGIAIGRGAQTLADQTITIGTEAGIGMKRTGTIPLAASHIVIGNQAGQSMQGMENIALGYKSGGNVQSNYNISIGSEAGRNILGSRTDPIGKNVSIGYHANFRKAVTQPGQNIPEPEPGTGPADPTAEPKMKIPSIAEDSQAIKLVQSTAIGSETLAANNGTAVGYQAQALGNSTAAYGFGAIAEGESSLALGTGANAKDGNIALGAGSIALKQDVENKLAALTGTKAKTGIVSVGNAEQGMLRRVTNVGDAVDEQDAVTLAQLRASMTQVSNDLMVKAQGELGKTDLHYDPAAIGGDPSITLQAGDNKTGTVIHNVAKGVHAGDAVNLAQLKEYTEKGMGHYFSTRTTGHKHNFANEGATGENSVAFGVDASATNKYSAAMGNYVQAQGEGSLAIGTGWFNENDKPTIEGSGEEVQPVMTKAYSGYRYNVAIGAGAQTEGNYSMAIGPRALTKKKAYKEESENTGVDYALSMGYLSTVYAKDGLAIGHLAEVHQPNGVAIGSESWSLRNKALAIGNHNTALGRESGTMGTRNGVSGDNSYVIGNDNMNLTDDDRKDVLDTIANAATKGISDNNSTVLGNRNTMVSKFKSFDGLDGKTSYQGIVRGEDNHIVGNENTLTRTNNSFVTGSTNELVETTSTFLVGSDNKLTNSNTISGVLGEKNEITSHHTTTLGNENKISGDSVKTLGERNEVSGANLAVIGNDNIQVAGGGANVFGNANTGVTTENGHVIGFSNTGIAGTDQQVLGSFNATINAQKSHVIGFTNTNVSGEDQRVIGNENNNISGNRNTVLGNKNKEVTAAEDTQLIGNANESISAAQAQILGNSNANISTKSGHVFGNMNSTIGGEKLSVIGDENSDIAGTQSLLFGYKNKQVQKDTANTQIMGNVNSNIAANRTQIIGNANKVGIPKKLNEQGAEGQDVTKDVLEPVKDAQIMGNNNQVQNNYVQVLGNRITTTLDQSVYLGDNAAYNEDETLSATNKEYTKDSIYGYDFAGTKPVGVVTVGAKGNERRLQNVAAGLVAATSTDAVNGSQLYQLTRPLHFAGDNSTFNEAEDHDKDTNVLHRGSNQNITIKGGADVAKVSDDNIGVVVDTTQNTMNVKLAKNLTDLETITFGKDGTSMKIDGTNQSISNIKKVTFGAPDSQDSLVVDGEKKIISGLSNTTWTPKDKRDDAIFDRSQAATQGQLADFEKSTQRGFDVYVNKDEADNKFTVQLGDEKKNDAFGFLAGNNLTVSQKDKQITYALKDDLAVGKEGQDGKDGSLTVHGKDGETVAINGKDGTVGINGKDGATVVMNGDGTVVAKGKGEDGKPGASVTIDGKNGITTIEGKTDDNNQKNTITLNGKDGKMGVTGKDGSNVTLNGQDGSIGMNGKNGTNAVSITTQNGTVGVDGQDGTTRLVVKEGTKVHELATMNDGMKFMGDAGTEDKLKLNEQLTVTGGINDTTKLSQDNNIGVIADGQKKLTLRLAKNIQGLDSITLGDAEAPMKIDGTKKTISRIEKMVFGVADSTDSLIMDGKEKVITGLSNTTLPEKMETLKADQAATQGQLKEVLDKIGKNIDDSADYRLVQNANNTTDKSYSVNGDGDINLTVQDIKHPDKKDTVTIKNVAKKSDLTASDKKFTDYAVKYDKNGDTVNKDSITLEGDTKTGTVIKNVGAGSVTATSKDAVNGSQLYKTNQGFDVYVKDNTDDNTFNVKLGDDTKDAFGFDAGNGLAIARDGKKITYSLQDDVSVGKAGQDGKDGKVTVNGKDGEKVTINGKNGEIGLQGPKGADGKDGNSITLSGKDGTIGVQGPKGADGQDGNSVTLNGKDGSIGIKGNDGKNAVSITTGNGKVGLDGKDGETRIIVKEGNHVNEVATMNDGLKFKGDDGTAVGVKLNNQVNIVGGAKIVKKGETITNLTDNNIGVESIVDETDGKNAKMKIRLAKNLSDLEDITFNSKDKTNPMKIDGDAKTISNVNKITGLTNTTLPTDGTPMQADQAASQGQLSQVLEKIENNKNAATDYRLVESDSDDKKYSVDTNGEVTLTVQDQNHKDKTETVTIKDIAKKSDLDTATKTFTDYAVKYDKNGDTVNKNSITLEGGNDGTVIKNVKAGDVSENSKDAVNGSQLYKTNQNVTNITNNLAKTNEGFDILVGEDTADNRANVALGKNNKETVEFAAGNSLEVTLDKNAKKVTYSLKDDITVGKDGEAGKDGKVTVNGKVGEKVTIDGKDGKIESKAKDGTTVTVNGKDGTVGATGTDGTSVTMNGKDGTIGGTGKDGTTVTMNAKDGTIGAQGPKGADGKDGASVTINGKDGTTIINGATDENGKKNTITLNGKDGTMGVDGKDGNSVTLNGQDGSIGMKGKDGTNAVSITTQNGTVGVDGKDSTTRLVVKEGTKTHELATMNDGMKFMGDVGTEDKLKLNEQLTVTGGVTDNAQLSQDNNIGVIADGQKTLTLRLAKELKGLDSITFGAGDTAMKIDGTQKTINNITKMTFGKPDSKDSIVVDGTKKVITGLSNTTLPKDMSSMQKDQAASQGQLNELLTKVQTEATDYRLVGNEQATDKKYTVDEKGEVTLTVQDQNHKDKTEKVTIKDVAKKSDLAASDKKFTDYAVKYDKDGDTVNKNSITLEGDTKTGTVIKNVGAGSVNEDSKEAVNGSQLYKTNKGFDVYIKDKTADNTFNVGLGADDKDAFGFDAGNGLEISKNGKKITYSLQDDVSVGKAGDNGKDGKITVNGKDGEKVTINGKNGEIGLQGPKGADGTDGNSVTLSGKDGTIGVQGPKGADGQDGNSVTLNGKDGSIGMKGKDGKNAV
ncbi:ESPR-type extended signal peptide-containing protein, partial [Veillonella montpellierensis]|uniref:ESPR-type extended signal peptide-containing protein n=1 Tax=Veillonella montpellierensis TaxID=187328 RepID=UPI0023F76B21